MDEHWMAIMTDVDKQIAELRLGNDSGGTRDCDWRMRLRAADTIQSLKDENERLKKHQCSFTDCRWQSRGKKAESRIAELEVENERLKGKIY